MTSTRGRLLFAAALVVAVGFARAAGHVPSSSADCDVRITERFRIGSLDGDQSLSQIGDAFLHGGRILVVQPQEAAIRVFSLDGDLIGSLGRSGAGPGEFRRPIRGGARGDTVWIWDPGARRMTFLTSQGQYAGSVSLSRTGEAVPFADTLIAFTPQLIAGVTPGTWGQVPLEVRDRATGAVRDSLWSIHVEPRIEIRSGAVTRIAPQPITDEALWDVSPDGRMLVFVDRDTRRGTREEGSLTIDLWTDGTIRTIEWSYVPVPLSSERVDGYVEIFSRSAREMIRDREVAANPRDFTPERVREALRLPRWEPTVTRLVIGTDGRIWMRREERAPRVAWTILDPASEASCEVVTDASVRLVFAGSDTLLGIGEGPYGIPQVVVYDLEPR